MNKFLSTIFLCFISTISFADNKDAASLEQQINTLTSAMVEGNANILRAVSSKHLSYGHSSGQVENQEEFIEKIASGRSDFVKIELKNQTITLSGDTALVRHELVADTADGGVANTIHLGIFLVWQKEGDTWKLLGRQAFKLPQ